MKNFSLLVLVSLIFPGKAVAQIIPDPSVGTRVTPNLNIKGLASDRIDGGAINGSNLFHSFSDFNVGAGRGVYFSNPSGITNIFTRITGANASNVNGTLGVLGGANLFLLNPNGIVFGVGARLDLQGSFLGTTASSIKFDSGTEFAATPSAAPLLTVSVPVGLGFGSQAAPITNLATRGLSVPEGKTLALVGGDLLLDASRLTAPAGRIELGSVAANSTVALSAINSGWELKYAGVQNFQDIALTRTATVSVDGAGGGNLQIQGRKVRLENGSTVSSNTTGANAGGNILLKGSESVILTGVSRDGRNTGVNAAVQSGARGKGSDINIEIPTLLVENGGRVAARTFGAGDTGNVTVRAGVVDLVGIAPNESSNSGIATQVEVGGTGKGGNLTVTATRVQVLNRAELRVATRGEGNAGKLTVEAKEMLLMGRSPSERFITGLSSTTRNDVPGDTQKNSAEVKIGRGGDIYLEVGRLQIRDATIRANNYSTGESGSITVKAKEVEVSGLAGPGSFAAGFSAGAFSNREGGKITIEADRIKVTDGGKISASTRLDPAYSPAQRAEDLKGDAGQITINAKYIELAGTATGSQARSGIEVASKTSGSAGLIKVTADRLVIKDGAGIFANGGEFGGAGVMEIKAGSLFLDEGGKLRADIVKGKGGNIEVDADSLLMRRGSSIITDAKQADGGNITLKADTIIQLENSDITAKAPQGQGGNIRIITQGLFRSPNSNLDASGRVNGEITISTPEVSTQNNLTQQTANFISTEKLVATSCLAQRNIASGRFVVTGTGSTPIKPSDDLYITYPVVEVREVKNGGVSQQAVNLISESNKPWKVGDKVEEATGLIATNDGRMLLTADSAIALADSQKLICPN